MKLCLTCGQKYHSFIYKECWDCSPVSKDTEALERINFYKELDDFIEQEINDSYDFDSQE